MQDASPGLPNFLGRGLPAGVKEVIHLEIPFPLAGKMYQFISGDEKWKVGLGKEFIALSTGSYLRWEEFRARMESVRSHMVRGGPSSTNQFALQEQLCG